MSFQRQLQRASMKQELELVEHAVKALHAENHQLQMENRSLYRAMGAFVAVAGGEVRIPRDMSDLLKGKHLTTDVDEATNEIVFRLVDATAAVEETSETSATTEQ